MTLIAKARDLLSEKIAGDILWSGVCLFLAAVGGLSTNLVLINFLGTEAVGVFGLGYALVVITSQVAVFGIQNSCLRHASVLPPTAIPAMMWSAILLCGATSAVVCTLLLIGAPFFDAMVQADLAGNYLALAVAVALFSLNQIFLATLNGLRLIRWMYSLQLLRVGLVLGYVTGVSLAGLSHSSVLASFLFSEVTMFCILTSVALVKVGGVDLQDSRRWARKHFSFGARSFATGLSVEAHTRIDLLVLAFFVGESALGIYTFISYFSEGLLQVVAVIRNNINPLLARAYGAADQTTLAITARVTKAWTAIAFTSIGLLIIALFVPAMRLLGLDDMVAGWPVLAILVGALVALSPILVFDTILTQFGRPGVSSILYSATALMSLALNVLAIPRFGLLGAAAATAISWLLLAGLLVAATRYTARFDLLRATFR